MNRVPIWSCPCATRKPQPVPANHQPRTRVAPRSARSKGRHNRPRPVSGSGRGPEGAMQARGSPRCSPRPTRQRISRIPPDKRSDHRTASLAPRGRDHCAMQVKDRPRLVNRKRSRARSLRPQADGRGRCPLGGDPAHTGVAGSSISRDGVDRLRRAWDAPLTSLNGEHIEPVSDGSSLFIVEPLRACATCLEEATGKVVGFDLATGPRRSARRSTRPDCRPNSDSMICATRVPRG